MDYSSDISADFEAYQSRVIASLKAATSDAVRISSQDLGFHRSSSEKCSKSLASQNAHLLRLTNKLLKCATKDTSVKAPTIQDVDGLEDNWRKVVDVIDDLLEKADASLDEYNGVIKRLSPAQQESPSASPTPVSNGRLQPTYTSHAISKPQLLFDRKVNNYEPGPWKPLLRSKPHAKKTLEESIGSGDEHYKHPYAYEIENSTYPHFVYEDKLPIPFTRPENSEALFIDTEQGVREMLEELKSAKEIAIDVEHNDKNSYVGLVCLMQISTRNKDWIVDTLKPWRENLQILNEVFADPNILKVFHGSTMDMVWLQRDLGLYVVGLFDTYHACVELMFPARSLAFLLQKYAYFQAQKQYQLADWRVRPLPKELLDYARSDTHYLLYVYDNLRNELIRHSTDENNLIDRVRDNSKKEALQTYEQYAYDRDNGLGPNGWMKLLLPKLYKHLTNEQFGVLRALHEWRDQKARQYDDGDYSILPHAYLWSCAEVMPLNRYELFKHRIGKAPRFVSEHMDEFISVVKQGKLDGQKGPSVQEVLDRNADKLGTLRNVQKMREQKPQDVTRSVAATLRQIGRSNEANEVAQGADSGVLSKPVASRSDSSRLWGTVKPLWTPLSANFAAAAQALQTVLPLQSFVTHPSPANVAAQQVSHGQGSTDDLAKPVSNGLSSAAVLQSQDSQDDVFVLSDMKRKRNADEASLEEGELDTDGVDDISNDTTQATPSSASNFKLTKSARKAAKKARKAAEKAEREAAQANMQPFDFANAPSLLSVQQSNTSTASQVSKPLPFNPFAKALNTSTGARRNKMGKEQPGKSHTFRS